MLRLSLCCFVFLMGQGLAEEQVLRPDIRETLQEHDIFIDAGMRPVLKLMGYGWGDNAHQQGWSGRWITHHEADVLLEVAELTDYHFMLRAAPALKMDKLQSIGLFINNRFIAKWVCPYDPDPKTYSTKIPAEKLNLGTNTLSLRIGYTTVPGGAEQRRLGLQVDYIHLRPDA